MKKTKSKTKVIYKFLIISLFLYASSTRLFAASVDEDLVGFDGIIKELSQGRTTYRSNYSDPFDNVLIHAGVGLVNSHITLTPGLSEDISGFHKGVEANIGIDLFSKNWKAEGTVRSYGDQKVDNNPLSLKEFDLKIVYQNNANRNLKYHFAFGLAARYLDVRYTKQTIKENDDVTVSNLNQVHEEYTTPSSILAAGASTYISKGLSMGVEFSYRNAMIDETIDKSSFDAIFRVDTHF
ncbi:MAG: hypothetical protein HOO06_12370 [Bdellovibrionaceae bacterium]|jgi:hypothetical protein|nr:hypothetical protein [Pseudobdellovibrionaceae bacterium]